MYAVVETGGKQYKVDKGSLLRIEKISGEIGTKVELDKVLLINSEGKVTIGRPLVAGAKVIGEVVRQARAAKVITYKYKPRKHSATLRGHRQYYTQIKILDVVTGQ